MKRNLGTTDRALRIIMAVILGALFFTDLVGGVVGGVVLVMAFYLLITAALAVCPLYRMFNYKTCCPHGCDGECEK